MEVKRTVLGDHTLIGIVISPIADWGLIEIIDKGRSLLFELHGLRCICILWLFSFVTFTCWAPRSSRVGDTATRVGLVVEWLLWVEFLVCVAHSLLIFLKSARSREGSVAIAKPRRTVARWSFVESYWGESLFTPYRRGVWYHGSPATVSVVSIASNPRVTGANTEITPIRVPRIIALAFTPPIFDVLFAVRTSLDATSSSIGGRGWIWNQLLITIFWRTPCDFLATRRCTWGNLGHACVCVTVVSCRVGVLFYLLLI